MNKEINPFTALNFYSLVDWLLKFALLMIIISVFVPLSPKMPAPGLDPSWSLGLNQAVAQGLSFGKDIVFTLGPYSAVYTKAYHPSTDFMMMSGSFYLAFSYWICLSFLMRGIKWHWVLLFCLLLFAMIYVRDSLFFSYPLLVGLACCKMISLEKQALSTGKFFAFYLALFFAPFGLLPLVKGSLLILSVIVAGLCITFFILNKKNHYAFICFIAPITSLIFFWLAAGQLVEHLLAYLNNTLALASGFTVAMSTEGNPGEIALYLANSVLILGFIGLHKRIPPLSRLLLLGLFFAFLFVSFKTAFIRHYGHAYIASSSILTAALLLPFIFNSKFIVFLILFSLNTWSYINSHYTRISMNSNCKSTYSAAWFGLKNRINNKQGLQQDFELAMNFLRERASFPQLVGTTDIYSVNQAHLIASQNTWTPRPIFQSYSVFTANLAEKNKQHLLEHRPNNIIFNIEPIDERIPSLEDGLSWPLILANYQPKQIIANFLFLQKKNRFDAVAPQLLVSEKHVLGEVVKVPQIDEPLFAEIEIKPTLWGHLAIFFYKPEQLQIHLELKNGIKKQYRFIANMAKSGFLLSPLVENTVEFTFLFNNRNALNLKTVKSLQISVKENKLRQWNNDYVIHYKKL